MSKVAAKPAGNHALPDAGQPRAPSRQAARKQATGAELANAPEASRQTAQTPENPLGDDSFIPREWMWMAPCMLGALLLPALFHWLLPHPPALTIAAGAVFVAAGGKLFLRAEQHFKDNFAARIAVMLVAVGLPMLLFGLAVAVWASSKVEPLGWQSGSEILILVASLSAVMLYGRLPTSLTAQVAIWSGVAIIAGEPRHYAILAAGVAVGIWLTRRQLAHLSSAAQNQQSIERRQNRAEKLLSEYEHSGLGWFWETDRRGAITYVSPTIGNLIGRSSASLVGRPFTDLFDLDAQGQERERTLNFHLSARSAFMDLAVKAATQEETERWWSISGRPTHDSFNNFLGFRGSGTDLTEMRRSQQHASRLAHYDSLTELANRFQMSEMLEKILGSPREDHRACAILLIDLDRFKQVNDTLGHPAGDSLLKQVAQRLEWTVGEVGRVGRLGGDEFQILLPGRIPREDIAKLAQRVIVNVSQPYSIDGHRVVIGASLGIALSPDDGSTREELIRNADLALYAAKDGGRGRHHFYAPDLHIDAEERRQMEQDLRDALTNGGFEMFYQPVVHTMTEKISGFEALLRWNHPVHGELSPSKFIPIAEDAGLIAPIGEWALRTACNELARWPAPVRVAVNVSPLQFANPALPAIVTNAIASAQIDPQRLELEITESVFLNDDSSTDAMFTALKRIGVRLALDDFGTGYSSLGYLKKAPFDKIKIDQSFVRGATIKGSRNGAIISSIVSLAEALGMETTAEGVETLDELDLVRDLGCSHVQGYIYDKALSAQGAHERLASGLVAVASGPRAARAARQTMLRKVVLEHGGQCYFGTIRNISSSGALIEGLWNVPAGTAFTLYFTADECTQAIARWSRDDRMGMEFAQPLPVDSSGRVMISHLRKPRAVREPAMTAKAG